MNNNFITFVGHSTLLIDIKGVKILTDPILAKWVYGIPRFRKAAISIDDINNKTDLILISHAHNDHLNFKTLKRISRKIPIVTHINNRKYIEKCKFDSIIELDYWKKKKFPAMGITITMVPASHAKTLPWGPIGTPGGFIIESFEKNIYFAGDTSFSESIFKKIAQKFKIDILLMPIGSYLPRWMLRSEHTDPKEALEVLGIIGAKKMIPIHWGSFMLAFDTPKKSVKVLKKKIKGTDLEDKVEILENGETFYF